MSYTLGMPTFTSNPALHKAIAAGMPPIPPPATMALDTIVQGKGGAVGVGFHS